jgi:hypothetical protein
MATNGKSSATQVRDVNKSYCINCEEPVSIRELEQVDLLIEKAGVIDLVIRHIPDRSCLDGYFHDPVTRLGYIDIGVNICHNCFKQVLFRHSSNMERLLFALREARFPVAMVAEKEHDLDQMLDSAFPDVISDSRFDLHEGFYSKTSYSYDLLTRWAKHHESHGY